MKKPTLICDVYDYPDLKVIAQKITDLTERFGIAELVSGAFDKLKDILATKEEAPKSETLN